jgi:pimeloyl-ACP methyl ester carboxylesterase
MVYIQGSGGDSITSVFSKFDWKSFASQNGYDVLFIEKFAFNDNKLFPKTYCRESRIADIEAVVNYVIDTIYNENLNSICLFSGSEGGAISPELALKIKKVNSLIVFGAGGYAQSKEFEILLQNEICKGKNGFWAQVGINNLNTIRAKFEEINGDLSTEKLWLGCTYKYWNSFLWYSPEEYIVKLTIPTLFIIGDADDSVPVESVTHLIPMLKGRPNFEFHILPGLDHSFKDANGNVMLNELIKKIVIPWLRKNNKIR